MTQLEASGGRYRGRVRRLNVPQTPGLALQTQVGLRLQEARARVSFHQQVDVFLGLVEAAGSRLMQGLLDLLSDVVVDVHLGEES